MIYSHTVVSTGGRTRHECLLVASALKLSCHFGFSPVEECYPLKGCPHRWTQHRPTCTALYHLSNSHLEWFGLNHNTPGGPANNISSKKQAKTLGLCSKHFNIAQQFSHNVNNTKTFMHWCAQINLRRNLIETKPLILVWSSDVAMTSLDQTKKKKKISTFPKTSAVRSGQKCSNLQHKKKKTATDVHDCVFTLICSWVLV